MVEQAATSKVVAVESICQLHTGWRSKHPLVTDISLVIRPYAKMTEERAAEQLSASISTPETGSRQSPLHLVWDKARPLVQRGRERALAFAAQPTVAPAAAVLLLAFFVRRRRVRVTVVRWRECRCR